ncbi:YdeI/OmpD-associated family protein [Massilia luteola]|uniref:YdeI/OmpD-associated family protein n=1 Tax=Massilia luteola TaxID=3081751 RepID=UPI002ACC03EB|nr:YdeI/OmpD-associated family protein [Massilia sp. Gc5]
MTAPVFFEDAAAFRAWLAAHAHEARELLVGFHKVGTGKPCMRWSDSVDQALCFGWIDGVRKGVDADTYTIRFTPRKAGSIWSAVNIDKVARLRELGLMTQAGEAAFALRSEDRSRVYSHERATPAELEPADLARFKRHKAAWAYFEACPPGYRKRMLHVVTSAKKPETRAARLDRLIAACAEGRRLDEWTPAKNT